ncbi:MAG TPA: cupin domain-containing protein [Alphaproteobacteria bacterium]|nr:cupin domain-containing protein [Alphaproteobacteria bacterium]
MPTKPFVVTPDNYARSLDVVGEKITVLASKDATQGYEIFLQDGAEGSGPPPHSHDWDETFYVVKGRIEITYANTTISATPGTLVHVPAGTVHCFRFGAGGGQMISVTSHNGHASELFADIDKESQAGPPDLAKLAEIAHRNSVNIGN